MRHVEPNDFVISMGSFESGIEHSLMSGKVSGDYRVLRPAEAAETGFFRWFLKSRPLIDGLASLTNEIRVGQRIHYSKFATLWLPLPDLETQRAIADYLDRETGEIDEMIAKMDELAETLEHRRASVIEMNTTARLGIFTKIKFCGEVALGKTVQGEQKHDDELFVNYVRAASIQSYGLELDDQRMWMTAKELGKYNLNRDDVLIVEGGAGFGRSVVLADNMPGWGFQNHVIRVRPDRRHNGRFLNYCVKGHYSEGLIGLLADGATIPGLSSEKARNLPVPELPLEEEIRIADHLDEVTGKIDAMLAKVAELKSLLIERRAALITEVVTGRKKVA